MYHHIDAISQSLCGLTTELTIARPPATYTEHGADYDLQCPPLYKDIGTTNTVIKLLLPKVCNRSAEPQARREIEWRLKNVYKKNENVERKPGHKQQRTVTGDSTYFIYIYILIY